MGRRRYIQHHHSGPVEPVEHRRQEQGSPPPSRVRRWLRRHRWQLVPVHVATGTYAVAAVADAAPAVGYGTLAVAGAAGLGLLQRVSDAERLYGRAVIAGATGWVLVADWAGPWTIGSASLLVAGLITGGAPWWKSHRVRGRIRVDQLVEAWPDWSARAQLGGVRIVSAQAGRVHDRLRLELVRGQQRGRHVVDHLEDLASVRGIPPWRLRVDPTGGGADPGQLDLLVTHTDPWRDDHGRPIDLPHPATTDPAAWCQPGSVRQPLSYGVEAGAATASVRLRNDQGGRLLVVVSKKGGGKTVLLHNLLAELCRAEDVDVAVVDCKEEGKATRAWAPRLIRRATTPAEALDLLAWAEAEQGRRGADSPDAVLQPTRTRRALVVVVDEYGALVLAEPIVGERVERLARTIRSASGALVVADQRVDRMTWSGALRGQIDEVIVGKLENHRDARAILPTLEGVDVTEFELPGQMVQQAGKKGRQIESRAWYLEDQADIAAIVEGCRDRWPAEQVVTTPINASRSTQEVAVPLPRGAGADAVRDQLRATLADITTHQDQLQDGSVPDLSAEEMRQRAQATGQPEPTAEEQTLDERIIDAIRTAPPGGVAMGDLERMVEGVPRSTLQTRAAALRRAGRVHTDPPRGRHARWHITESDAPAMSNA